ncbi:MAG: hypothetical protein HOE90_02180 [Bacteriovoracaceae bacterium]|jgi:hypothetical protein|nr:hypothetical protein [Bacteriovoracaceae bacterium]
MNLSLVHTASIEVESIDQHILNSRENRRATPLMVAAKTIVSSAINSLKDKIDHIEDELAVVAGTTHGELSQTLSFFKKFKEKGIYSPTIFQNSLHNSVLGLVSTEFNLGGIGMTISHGILSGEKCLEASADLIAAGRCNIVMAICFDCIPRELESCFSNFSGSDPSRPTVSLAIFALPEFATQNGLEVQKMGVFSVEYNEENKISMTTRIDSSALLDFIKTVDSGNSFPYEREIEGRCYSRIYF